MLRRTFFLSKVNRSWTSTSIKASAKFPDAVRAADPAAKRTGSTSAKETRVWTVTEDTDAAAKPPVLMRDVNSLLPAGTPSVVKFGVKKLLCYGNLVRFDKPVGWMLLLIPCYWGSSLAVTKALVWEGADPIVLAAPFIPVHLILMFLAGAYLMRSAGCVVNDMWDREFDRKVERTRTRPLASGDVSMVEASAVLFTHVALAGVIAFNLSPAALAACLAITPVWVMYPFMKRITYAPQLFLGLCFNWGIFVGYAAVLGRVDLAVCLPIYFAAVIWTIVYDTIYAYQDRKDDLLAGVKSTAIWIGDRKYILNAMTAPIGLGMLVSGFLASQSLPFYLGIMVCMYRLNCIIDDVNIYDGWSCSLGFRRNVRLGLYVLLSMILGNALWTLASTYEPEKDRDSSSALQSLLYLSNTRAEGAYDPSEFGWADRAMHPVFVRNKIAEAKGEKESPPIPAWMRREYLGENTGTLLLLLGFDKDKVESWQRSYYSWLDHYNVISKIQF